MDSLPVTTPEANLVVRKSQRASSAKAKQTIQKQSAIERDEENGAEAKARMNIAHQERIDPTFIPTEAELADPHELEDDEFKQFCCDRDAAVLHRHEMFDIQRMRILSRQIILSGYLDKLWAPRTKEQYCQIETYTHDSTVDDSSGDLINTTLFRSYQISD